MAKKPTSKTNFQKVQAYHQILFLDFSGLSSILCSTTYLVLYHRP